MNQGPFTDSDLPINSNGRIYHLDLLPEELAKDIIIVGDPDRVSFIADQYFSDIEVDRNHRGLKTNTGTVRATGQKVSLITSGMGTSSLEIVLNELVALNEIDFKTRKRKKEYGDINIIRVGTSGGLQRDTKVGTSIITNYSIGTDNSGLFVDVPYADSYCKKIEESARCAINHAISPDSRFKDKIMPYVSKADPSVVSTLESEAKKLGLHYKVGITASASGIFAQQGRDISRLPLTVPDIDEILSKLDFNGLKVENMEMESSFLLHFMNSLGYKAGAICPAILNRRKDTFAQNYEDDISNATNVALHALFTLRT